MYPYFINVWLHFVFSKPSIVGYLHIYQSLRNEYKYVYFVFIQVEMNIAVNFPKLLI